MEEYLKFLFDLMKVFKKKNSFYESFYESPSRNIFLRYLNNNRFLKRKPYEPQTNQRRS